MAFAPIDDTRPVGTDKGKVLDETIRGLKTQVINNLMESDQLSRKYAAGTENRGLDDGHQAVRRGYGGQPYYALAYIMRVS